MKKNIQYEEIKLILLDLDGTLLNSQKEISPENFRVLSRAAEKGIHIVPCTGRFYAGMPELVRNLPFVRYAITVNGGDIYDAKEEKSLYTALISPERADEVFEELDKLPVIYDCFQDGWGWMDRTFYEKIDDYAKEEFVRQMNRNLRTPVDGFRNLIRSRNRGVQKIQMLFQDMELRSRMIPALQQRFPDLAVASSISNNIEINSCQAQKGVALLELCRHLGISPKATMAFGDGLNDISMLQAAAVGVAMANAEETVRNASDYVTDTNDRDGVAKAVLHFCFGE